MQVAVQINTGADLDLLCDFGAADRVQSLRLR